MSRPLPEDSRPLWHHTAIEETFTTVAGRPEGLSVQEAQERLRRHGPNILRPQHKHGPLVRFLLQFHNVLFYVLLVAAAVTALLGEWIDSGVILGVVLVNALIGFLQEGKAEKSLEAIRSLLSHQALVRRDGRPVTIDARDLVPGDVVLLQSGDKVPADLRLYQVKDLRIDESLLTGESVPVEKDSRTVAPHAPIGDRLCMAYSGTLVTYGQARGLVVATGDHTELGRISDLLREVQTLTTPLLRKMATFARWLSGVILVIAALTAAFGRLAHGYTAGDMFLAAVGLAVAAIPEGLPAIMTITLAIGVQRMARRNAIIRRLPAVETLGSVTVICSDKTGTLTRNEMTVRSLVTAESLFEVTGTGYDPHGTFRLDGTDIEPAEQPLLQEMARAALLCNDARLEQIEAGWCLHGDPTEGALISLGMKAGLDPAFEQAAWPRTDVIPFESQHRFMASLHHDHAGHGFIYIKGAPERIMEMCNRQRLHGEDLPLDPRYWHSQMEVIAGRGERLLAIAFRTAVDSLCELRFSDIEGSLTLLGVVGMIDPPREEAIRAIATCREAGIRVKMITGDHAVTARAIGAQIGLGDGEHAINGHELDAMDAQALRAAARRADIFARTSPEHKLRLVEALQADGQVVAMTGDGVNDAPALKRANVGVAMGLKGTEVSKEAAEMILADDNFASIAHAVEEGRTVYDNLKKAILFILPTNGGEALTLIAAILLGRMLPITPAQILWINMVTAVTLALALAFEPAEPKVMRRAPTPPGEPLLSPLLIWRIVFVSLILMAGTFGLFLWERAQGTAIEEARTIAVNTLVMFEVFYLFNARYITESAWRWQALFGNPYIWAAVITLLMLQALFTYAPFMQLLFASVAIEPTDWAKIVVVASSVFFLVELEKALLRRGAIRAD